MKPRVYTIYKSVMALKPEILLSTTYREQCVKKLNELPKFIESQKQTNAAVLVPLCVVDNEVCLLYTLRSSKLSKHSGQVSFPGGKMDSGESVYQTAARETEEEIGFPTSRIDIWTKMSEISGSDKGTVITPVVAELKNIDVKLLKKNDSEVADIFTVPMKHFCDRKNHASFVYNNKDIPIFLCGNHKVWGITGIITHVFLECFLPRDIYEADFTRKSYKFDELMPAKL